MPRRETAPIGAPCWVDLLTSDPDASRSFYGELFGWKAEDPNAEFGGYWNFLEDDVHIAGGMRNDGSSGQPDLWSVYLATADAHATADAAESHGGQVVVPPMAVGDLGTMAMIVDAGGAAIGMWQPGVHKGFRIVGEPGAPSWFELHTRDYDKSVDFYRAVFDWDTHEHADSPEFRYTTLGADGDETAGIMDAASFLPAGAPGAWSIYFGVEDTDAALTKVEELGGRIVQPAQDTPYGRLAEALDSTGASFKLMAGKLMAGKLLAGS